MVHTSVSETPRVKIIFFHGNPGPWLNNMQKHYVYRQVNLANVKRLNLLFFFGLLQHVSSMGQQVHKTSTRLVIAVLLSLTYVLILVYSTLNKLPGTPERENLT